MAAVKGSNISKLEGTPARLPDVYAWHGRMRVQYDDYEAVALADGWTIAFARMPAGARLLDMVVHHDALGASTTLAIGTAGLPALFVPAQATSSAGTIVQSIDGDLAGFGHVFTGTTDLVLTLAGADASGSVRAAVFYAVD